MADVKKIFAILDPTTMEQSSLIVAESMARAFNAQPSHAATLHVYCCVDEKSIRAEAGAEPSQAHTETRERMSDWIERLVAPARSLGLTVDTEAETSADWRKAIVVAVARQNCMLAIKGMSQHTRLTHLFRDTSDWQLIRDSACPVYLVKTAPNRPIHKVLAAIKHRTEQQVYTEANELILQTARGISSGLGAELHVVTAYKDNFNYPDRQKFADRCGLPRNHVRAEMSPPPQAIAAVAKDIGADLIVIARVGKPETKHAVGHTAEKIIDTLDADLLVLPMTAPV
jgi:nucleotide-binding universal stress UspA family protein